MSFVSPGGQEVLPETPFSMLVLVNYGKASGQDLLSLAAKIIASVYERFGVQLVPEPNIIGASY